jgi:chromosome segregation ATPase
MVAELKSTPKRLYETDYSLWVQETVKQLQDRDFNALDLENLIEEVADLSRRDRKKLKNLLRRLFEHLLKLKYWEAEIQRNERHWQSEILNFRQQIQDEIEDSPSLKPYLQQILNECYQDARKLASIASTLSLDVFPEVPIANLEQVLDEDWLPKE